MPAPDTGFLTVITAEEYEDLGRDHDFSEVASIEDAEEGEQLVLVWGHPSGVYYQDTQVFNPDGDRSARWDSQDDFGSSAGVDAARFTPREEGRWHFQLILSGEESGQHVHGSPYNVYVHVDEGEGGGEPATCDALKWFNITLDDSKLVNDGDRVYTDDGFGFSLNWGVDSSVDDVLVTLEHDGDEYFESDNESDSEYTDWDDVGEGTVTARIRVEDDGATCTERIDFEVREPGSTGSTQEGRLEIDIRVTNNDGGNLDRDDVDVRIEDDDGDFVARADDGDRFWLDAGDYILEPEEEDGYRISFSRDCDEISGDRAEVDLDRGDDLLCRVVYNDIDDGGGTTDPDPAECSIASGEGFILCDEDGDLIDHGDSINLSSGDVITAVWDAAGTYESTWFSVYSESEGRDIYTSSSDDGNREFEMGDDLANGNYQFRFSVYNPTRIHRIDVTIR